MENTQQKLEDITEKIADLIEEACDCVGFSADYLTNTALFCGEDPNAVVYVATVVSTEDIDSTDLLSNIQEVSTSDTEIVIGGIPLKLSSYCSMGVQAVEGAECAPRPTLGVTGRHTASGVSLTVEVIGAVFGVLLVIIVGIVIVAIACSVNLKRKARARHLQSTTM